MRYPRIGIICAFAIALLSLTAVSMNAQPATNPQNQDASVKSDSQIQSDLVKAMSKDRFKTVQATANGGTVTLSGKVGLFADKEEADRKAHHIKNVIAVRNDIEVARATVSDQELQEKLVKKLEYDRVGYGTTAFNAISVSVTGGVVTLGGHAYGPIDKDSAHSVAAYFPGVQDVMNDIEVDPASPMDDRIRIDTARAVYGQASLNKYAMDPAKPIRISVQHGNVTLYGVVDNKADKDIAFIRANGVPGVFKVTNELQVEGDSQLRD